MEERLRAGESISRIYFSLAVPNVLSMVVTIFYNMADTYFIAQTQNADLVAGVSLCAPLFTLLMAFGNIFGQGGCSLVSRLLGQKNEGGVGKYIPPVFREVELTPEEQEELRKKEEIRDKRHRAYLRRKASGWQQEYDRKRSAQRKPIMDAMKAAIRQEDMAKGIYAHVADLPHQEPKRAAMQVRPAV